MALKLLSGLKAGGGIVIGVLINLVLIPVVMFYLLARLEPASSVASTS